MNLNEFSMVPAAPQGLGCRCPLLTGAPPAPRGDHQADRPRVHCHGTVWGVSNAFWDVLRALDQPTPSPWAALQGLFWGCWGPKAINWTTSSSTAPCQRESRPVPQRASSHSGECYASEAQVKAKYSTWPKDCNFPPTGFKAVSGDAQWRSPKRSCQVE